MFVMLKGRILIEVGITNLDLITKVYKKFNLDLVDNYADSQGETYFKCNEL